MRRRRRDREAATLAWGDGSSDLGRVRYEFPSGNAVISLGADLAAGRLDRASIAAVCPSGR